MNSEQTTGADEALLSRLSVVEGESLTQRAAGYSAIYDELRQRLEGGDASRS
jgi:hypothetical protein